MEPGAGFGAMLAGEAKPPGSTEAADSAETAAAALALLHRSISVDVHTHGGRTGISSKALPSHDLANHMREGALAVACLADVPDAPVLGRDASGALSALRTPAPGELYTHHLERLAWMDELVANHGVRRALDAADLEAAHRRGLRHLQLVHDTPNDIGDFQTGASDGPRSLSARTRRRAPAGRERVVHPRPYAFDGRRRRLP